MNRRCWQSYERHCIGFVSAQEARTSNPSTAAMAEPSHGQARQSKALPRSIPTCSTAGAVSHAVVRLASMVSTAIDPHRLHAPSGSAGRGSLRIWHCLDCLHQRFPILWRIASIEHLGEHRISVALRAIGPQCLAVIDPGEDDDLGARRVAKKQPEAPTAELGTKPVFAVVAKCAALPELGTGRVDGNQLEHQAVQLGEQLGIGRSCISFGVFGFRLFDRAGQLFELIEKKRMAVKRPTIDGGHAELPSSDRDVAADCLVKIGINALGEFGNPLGEIGRERLDRFGAAFEILPEKPEE